MLMYVNNHIFAKVLVEVDCYIIVPERNKSNQNELKKRFCSVAVSLSV